MQTESEQETIQSNSKQHRGRWIGRIIVLVAVLVLIAAAALFFLKKIQPSDEQSGAMSQTAASEMEEDREAQAASEEKTEFQEDSTASQPEKEQTVQETKPDEPAVEENAPAIQIDEEWGKQEILISPTGAGKATLTLRQEYQGEWTTLFECDAAIGRNGTTATPAEGDGKTPAGTFPVLFCYGLQPPQTGIPFIQLTSDSVWVDDSESIYYNCLTTREQAGNASFEDTYSQFSRGYYSYNIFFANNGDGQTPGMANPGMGSVRVLEGYTKELEPTNGDVKISSDNMQTLLGLLNAAYSPVVTVSGS